MKFQDSIESDNTNDDPDVPLALDPLSVKKAYVDINDS
jgi:hypothetical protein